MSNGHDKEYRVVELSGKTGEEIRVELNQAVADGFGEFYGCNDLFVFLYQGKPK